MTQTQKRSDEDLKSAIVHELTWTPSINDANIGVAVLNGSVTLSGAVSSYPERRIAAKAAMRVPGVTAIAQEITVRSDWGTVDDADLARAAGQAIDSAVNVPAEMVKVAVHDHRVTLSGSVAWNFQREAALRAVEYLKGVDGIIDCISLHPVVSAVNLKSDIRAAFVRIAAVEGEGLTVTADAEGVVTLEGHVRTWRERTQAERLAWSAPGVINVRNRLGIQA